MLKNLSISCFLLLITLSCSRVIEPEKAESIFEKYKGSVVLIASEYYYEIYVGRETFYYSPNGSNRILFSKEEVLNNLSYSTGTGFIISDKGEIITNNHVVNHKDETFRQELVNLYNDAKQSLASEINRYIDSLKTTELTYNEYSEQLTPDEDENLKNQYNFYKDKKDYLIAQYNRLSSVDLDAAKSKLIIHKLGIAYNDTYVTNSNDLQECVVVKVSENNNVDLALIQTKNKSFLVAPKQIFNFKDNNPNLVENPSKTTERDIKNPIKINEDVFMIGFNRGFSLANTKQGIKSQFTSGKISQENDGERILYTIPTLEGSSGSPIVDKWGNLVGVNFAKITNSQSFSFAVPVYELKKFYEN